MAKFKVKFQLNSNSQPIEIEIEAPNIFEAKELVKRQNSPYKIWRIDKIIEPEIYKKEKTSFLKNIFKISLFFILMAFAIKTQIINKKSEKTDEQTTVQSDGKINELKSNFVNGQSSRHAWDAWIKSLSNEERSGAEYWAGERSKPAPEGCDGTVEFSHGCFEAQRRLSIIDKERQTNSDFRKGWNNP